MTTHAESDGVGEALEETVRVGASILGTGKEILVRRREQQLREQHARDTQTADRAHAQARAEAAITKTTPARDLDTPDRVEQASVAQVHTASFPAPTRDATNQTPQAPRATKWTTTRDVDLQRERTR